jgi:hypothetical protein
MLVIAANAAQKLDQDPRRNNTSVGLLDAWPDAAASPETRGGRRKHCSLGRFRCAGFRLAPPRPRPRQDFMKDLQSMTMMRDERKTGGAQNLS